jgi:uncharacterized membrane protein
MQWVEFVNLGWWAFLIRWLHIISGVMWIGHLWYFNFTQTPTMPKIPAELRPAVVRYILPEALFWFRWGAMFTLIFGLILAWLLGFIGQALSLGIGQHDLHFTLIGFGMWFGIIMWFNVWFLIWPNQKKVMGLVTATPDEVNAARRTAGLASRVNTMLSIPMLYAMASSHYFG